ncbi:MAG: substrate-binding periplasmic protein, partial [Alphaproteobacteria bacterium]
MAIHDLDALAHELVVVGLVARRATQLRDAGALRDVDPDLGDQHPFEVEAGDHGRTLAEPCRSDKRARFALASIALALLASGCAARAGGRAAPRTVRVGTSGDYPPYSASTGDGTLRGFDVESAQAWARDRGHRLELIAFRWPELESRLENGDFDVAMSGVTVRGDRLARSPMSSAVARTEAVLVTRAGAPRFDPSKGGAGLVVAVNRGGHMERVARASLPRADIRPNDDNRSLADLLARGAVDAVVVDAAELASFYPDPEGQMPPIAAVLSRDRKAWWVSRKDPALAD